MANFAISHSHTTLKWFGKVKCYIEYNRNKFMYFYIHLRAPTTFLYATESKFLSSFDSSTPVSVTDFIACAMSSYLWRGKSNGEYWIVANRSVRLDEWIECESRNWIFNMNHIFYLKALTAPTARPILPFGLILLCRRLTFWGVYVFIYRCKMEIKEYDQYVLRALYSWISNWDVLDDYYNAL